MSDTAFRRVHEALSGERSAADRRRRLLRAVRDGLDAETVFLSRVDPVADTWQVLDAVGPGEAVAPGVTAPLSETFCRHALDGEWAITDTRRAADDPGYWRLAVGSYLGRRVAVDGDVVGTLGVAGAGPREAFTAGQRRLVGAAADALAAHPAVAGVETDADAGDATARGERERRLDELLDRTRALLRATSRAGVAATVERTVEETLGLDRATVYLHDGDRDLLLPAAAGDDPHPLAVSRVHEPGDGLVGEAYATGETRVRSAATAAATGNADSADEAPAFAVPLADHGVVGVDGEVDPVSVSLAGLVAETAVAALDRAARSERLSVYEDVLDSSRDTLFAVDDAGRLTFVSAGLVDRLGYDRTDLVEEHLSTVLARDGVAAVADAAREMAGDGRATGGRPAGGGVTVETEMVTAEGDRLPVELGLSLLGDGGEGVVAVVREIADLEAVREELSQERTRFSRLFETLPDPALEVEVETETAGDGATTVRTVNPAFEAAFEVTDDEVVGESLGAAFADGLADGERDPVDRVQAAVRERQTVSFQLRQSTSDGLRDFVFQAVPYRETEDCVEAFGIYTDITEQRDRERRLAVLNRVLRHNLRNQLNVVDGYAEYLAKQLAGVRDEPPDREDGQVTVAVDPETADAAAQVSDAARRVIDLADEARRALRTVDDTDDGPHDLLDSATDALEAHAADHPDRSFTLDLPDGEWTPGDPGPEHPAVEVEAGSDLRLVLDQLVENAVVHTPPETPVAVCLREEAAAVELRVADDGPGIPTHERAVVAGDREPTQLEHGSGLGLWVVRWVVESNGGTVDFEGPAATSEAGADGPGGGSADEGTDRGVAADWSGTTVVVRLPSV